jgi:hypothetical protein
MGGKTTDDVEMKENEENEEIRRRARKKKAAHQIPLDGLGTNGESE